MKSFKEFVREVEQETASSRLTLVIYHFDENDHLAEHIVRTLLNEEKPSVDMGKGRRILFHHAHVANTEDHLHFVVKGAKIAAVNRSGTAHDKSHGLQLQQWALDGMAQHYPDFKRPKDGLIEQLMGDDASRLLTESFKPDEVLLLRATMLDAESEASKR